MLKRYESYGWHVQTVNDVNDLDAVRAAIASAKAETSKPSMIKVLYSTLDISTYPLYVCTLCSI